MILLELLISSIKNMKLYDKKEAISNIACGVVQQVGDAAINLLLIPFYLYLQSHYGVFKLESSLILILAFFVAKDFAYYWIHRLGHENRFLWGIHLVHHQPKVYNYSVGLRMPLFHHVVDIFPFMLFALIGIPLEVFVPVSIIWASLQILTHTTFIKKEIPLFSRIFVTPSHHRVHHGKNDIYIDKNYGGIFSFWDRAFGTYQKELDEVPVEYGVLDEQQYTLDPIAANFVYWKTFKNLFQASYISSMRLLIVILTGSFFVLNAKTLSVMQAFVQSFLLIVIFEIMIRGKKLPSNH